MEHLKIKTVILSMSITIGIFGAYSMLNAEKTDNLERYAVNSSPLIVAAQEKIVEIEASANDTKEAIALEQAAWDEANKPVVDTAKPQPLDKMSIVNAINTYSVSIGSPLGADYGGVWYDMGIKYGIHPYVGVAIATADTSMGKHLSTPYNLGNVGNTDSCPRCTPKENWTHGIEAIFQTLTNPYLGNAYKLCHLSVGGWNTCPEGRSINGGKFYASSPVNWQNNTYSVMAQLLPGYTNEFNYQLNHN